MSQHLVNDYNTLSTLIEHHPTSLGGLRLFEGAPDQEGDSKLTPSPIVTLNESQRAAVAGILAAKPVTVISGPPGCGKSQVVLYLMLNAWENGVSVLFASNNNQAVDVVRQRLERFEDRFPIAVRAGSKAKSNVNQALRDTLNFITGKRTSEGPPEAAVAKQRADLIAQQDGLKSLLDSKLPQRVDEAVRSALNAYATYQQTLGSIRTEEKTLRSEVSSLSTHTGEEDFATLV
ncbi:MAG: AAA domain-containing protein, partial [Bacteroidota bacterium]